MAEALFFQENEGGLFIRADGHVTAAVSTDLRELILGRLAQSPVPGFFGVDLSRCEYMDSTFMGLLVGFHKRYRALTGRPLTLLRPTAECIKLLTSLGILRLMTVVPGPEPQSPETWTSLKASQGPSPEVLLNAHRNLSELSPENAKKFSTLESVLQQQVDPKASS